VKIAVLASGRGSNFRAIQEHIQSEKLDCKISVLICDKPSTGALDIARRFQISTEVISPGEFPTMEKFGSALMNVLGKYRIDFIFLAGYLRKIPINVITRFSNRIFNIHPALLPSFGGKGMYGKRVHEAVFQAGVKVSGVTIHLVNSEYDAGPIVLQKCVSIEECTSPDEIAAKVLTLEHKYYPQMVNLLLAQEIAVNGKRVVLRERKDDQNK